MKVNILEAKNRLSNLIKSAQAGEEVVIANRGEPVARLIAIRLKRGSEGQGQPRSGLANWLRNNPLPPHLQRSHNDIQNSIAQERAAWD